MMMRSAKCVASGRREPPKPRLITWCLGKSDAIFAQRRMLELPTKTTALVGGGFWRSAVSKAAMSFSQRAGLRSAALTWKVASRARAAERQRRFSESEFGSVGTGKFLNAFAAAGKLAQEFSFAG